MFDIMNCTYILVYLIIEASRLIFLKMFDYFNLKISQLTYVYQNSLALTIEYKSYNNQTIFNLNQSFDFILLEVFFTSSFIIKTLYFIKLLNYKLLYCKSV